MSDNPAPSIPARWGALALALFVVGVGLLFYHGRLESSDEILMAATSAAIAERASFTFEEPIYGQLHTGYGMGMPLVGVPAYFAEKLFRLIGWISPEGPSLFILTPLVLSAACVVFLGIFGGGDRRWGALALAFLMSPLVAGAQRFYSEILVAAALAGIAAALERDRRDTPPRWLPVAVLAAAAIAMLARSAALPFLLLALAWGWRGGARATTLASGIVGCALGAGATLLQNLALRGGLFATGYVGQDFTTPIATGIHGLLFSPERGALLFFPALVLPLLAWRHLDETTRRITVLAAAMLLFSTVFHGVFWTWHGGWTAGPRFLLPAMILFLPGIAAVLLQWRNLGPGLRIFLLLAGCWGVLINFIYLRHSPMDWWRLTWGFHQVENQFLFMPQLSLWQAWLEGVPLSAPRDSLPKLWRMGLTAFGVASIAVALYPLILPFRGYVGTAPEAALRPLFSGWLRPLPIWVGALGVVLLLMAGVRFMSGPRGWEIEGSAANPSHLMIEGIEGTFSGWLDYPLATPLRLYLRASGPFRLSINGETVLEETSPGPAMLTRADVPLQPGLHLVELRLFPRPGTHPARADLFWTWGGEGRYMAPAGGEYVHPRPPGGVERFFTRLWRRKEIAAAGLLALLLLISGAVHGPLRGRPPLRHAFEPRDHSGG